MNLGLKHGLFEIIALALVPIYFLGFGLRGILAKKAQVVSTRRISWAFVILFVPLFLSPVGFTPDSRKHSFILSDLTPLLFMAGMWLVMWKMRGYVIWGASEECLQNALRETLQKLNLPFEESFARIQLTSLDADLIVSVSGSGALLKLKQHRHDSVLKQIAKYMNLYFATVPGKTNLSVFYIQVVMGAWMLFQELPLILKVIH